MFGDRSGYEPASGKDLAGFRANSGSIRSACQAENGQGPRADFCTFGRLEEVLNFYLFKSLTEVKEMTNDWLRQYNGERPHESLGNLTPAEFLMKNSPKEVSTLQGTCFKGRLQAFIDYF